MSGNRPATRRWPDGRGSKDVQHVVARGAVGGGRALAGARRGTTPKLSGGGGGALPHLKKCRGGRGQALPLRMNCTSLHRPFPGLLFPKYWEYIPYRLGNASRYSVHRTMCSLFLIFDNDAQGNYSGAFLVPPAANTTKIRRSHAQKGGRTRATIKVPTPLYTTPAPTEQGWRFYVFKRYWPPAAVTRKREGGEGTSRFGQGPASSGTPAEQLPHRVLFGYGCL